MKRNCNDRLVEYECQENVMKPSANYYVSRGYLGEYFTHGSDGLVNYTTLIVRTRGIQ